eukprot:11573345-Alexandrium_andersonii.AAC.1
MSASLVGSEMCIRDRRRAVDGQEEPARQGEEEEDRGQQPSRINRSFHWPVSYTHLTLPTICSV